MDEYANKTLHYTEITMHASKMLRLSQCVAYSLSVLCVVYCVYWHIVVGHCNACSKCSTDMLNTFHITRADFPSNPFIHILCCSSWFIRFNRLTRTFASIESVPQKIEQFLENWSESRNIRCLLGDKTEVSRKLFQLFQAQGTGIAMYVNETVDTG